MYSTEGEVLKISKGALVVLKGLRQDILDILQASTTINLATVLASSFDDDHIPL